jgi:hypothetical protein
VQPASLHDFLERYYATQIDKAGPHALWPNPPRVLPGRSPTPAAGSTQQQIVERVATAEKVLFQDRSTCGECHFYEKEEGQIVPRRIVPPDLWTVWLPHAKFSHAAHRAVECQSCHPGARESTRAEDILLPAIEVCVECHAPASKTSGGARFDCTECHRYHNGSDPLHGVGSEQRGAQKPRSLKALLP